MKATVPTRTLGLLTLTASLLAITTVPTLAQSDVPHGTLSVDKDLTRVGTRPNLEWDIELPAAIEEILTISNTGTIVPKERLKMRVRVLGVAFQAGSTLLPVEAYWSRNGSDYSKFFDGTSDDVRSSRVLISQTVRENDTVDFGARGWTGSGWYPFYHTKQNSNHVTVLSKGSTAPSYAPAYDQDSVTSFLRPYISASGKIDIGDRDLIILWESSNASPGHSVFDMQDLMVLVSFE